jgi:hypothetical protein
MRKATEEGRQKDHKSMKVERIMFRNKIIMDVSAAKQPKQKKPELTPDFHHRRQARLFSHLAAAKHTRALLERGPVHSRLEHSTSYGQSE